MGRTVSIAIVVLAVAAGGGMLWQRQEEQRAKAAIDASLADARAQFQEWATEAIGTEGADAYRRRILTALQAYELSLVKVYRERPEWRDVMSFRRRLAEQLDAKGVPAIERPRKYEGFDIVKEAYEVLTSGAWKSVLTQAGGGNTRLDIYDVRRVTDEQGQPRLEGRFFFWGLDETARVDWGQLEMKLWHTVDKKVRRKTVEVKEVYGGVRSDDGPRVYIDNPARYIDEFPPYVAVGYLRLPVMPREAEAFDLAFRYRVKKAGTKHDVELKWTKVPIPSSWQLQPGKAWEADVIEATEDEIAGRDAPADGQ